MRNTVYKKVIGIWYSIMDYAAAYLLKRMWTTLSINFVQYVGGLYEFPSFPVSAANYQLKGLFQWLMSAHFWLFFLLFIFVFL